MTDLLAETMRNLGITAANVWVWPVCEVTKDAYDGDTVQVAVDMGREITWSPATQNVRLLGINAPEIRGGTAETRAAAIVARDYLRGLIPVGTAVQLLSVSYDKYGDRVDAVIIRSSDGLNVNQAMLDSGNAVPYNP